MLVGEHRSVDQTDVGFAIAFEDVLNVTFL